MFELIQLDIYAKRGGDVYLQLLLPPHQECSACAKFCAEAALDTLRHI